MTDTVTDLLEKTSTICCPLCDGVGAIIDPTLEDLIRARKVLRVRQIDLSEEMGYSRTAVATIECQSWPLRTRIRDLYVKGLRSIVNNWKKEDDDAWH